MIPVPTRLLCRLRFVVCWFTPLSLEGTRCEDADGCWVCLDPATGRYRGNNAPPGLCPGADNAAPFRRCGPTPLRVDALTSVRWEKNRVRATFSQRHVGQRCCKDRRREGRDGGMKGGRDRGMKGGRDGGRCGLQSRCVPTPLAHSILSIGCLTVGLVFPTAPSLHCVKGCMRV